MSVISGSGNGFFAAPPQPVPTGGDNVNLVLAPVPPIGSSLDYRQGNQANPDTSLNPPIKVSRTINILNSAITGDGSAQVAAISGTSTELIGPNQVQPVGVYGAAIGSGAVVGTYGFARSTGTTRAGKAVGSFGQGQGNAAGTGAQGGQFIVWNLSGSDNVVAPTTIESFIGHLITPLGNNKSAVGLEIAAPTSPASFDVGLHLSGANGGLSAVTAGIQDDSHATTAYVINGTHTTGIDFSGATLTNTFKFPAFAGAGATTPTLGTTGPMTTATPAGFVKVLTSTGSTGYIPVWV